MLKRLHELVAEVSKAWEVNPMGDRFIEALANLEDAVGSGLILHCECGSDFKPMCPDCTAVYPGHQN